jgi:thiol:disulfide interchange protein
MRSLRKNREGEGSSANAPKFRIAFADVESKMFEREKFMSLRKAITATLLGAAISISAIAQSPIVKKHIYPETTTAQADLDAAIAKAHHEHKRVLVDFGGDWCPDCQVLDIYANQSPNAEILAKYFVKVNVNIGHIDTNKDIATRCGVDLHGVPALAVLDGHGKVIFGQHNEFSDMRNLKSSDLTDFLNKWKQ